ncbi:MAG: SIS domain-containing protein [Bacteroidetes bacterium]|nr:SIS domain-containing protein [Bacteroidota bacterium]
MQLASYKEYYTKWMNDPQLEQQMQEAVTMLRTGNVKRIYFIGNGGSNSICSHMMEDYAKIGRFRTHAFSDAALITCYANDYGYERAMAEWLKLHFESGDLLVAISSSGESKNILNAVAQARELGGRVLTLSGFEPHNTLSRSGDINFVTPVRNYGIVECFHQTILHIILDSLHD